METCQYCRYCDWVGGRSRDELVCGRKAGSEGERRLVDYGDRCGNYSANPAERAELESDVRRIPLTRGKFAIVDAEDYARLSRYNWYAQKRPHTFYAVRRGTRKAVKRTAVFMHRVITDAPGGLVVDHIDHNGINNRKRNLRVCTAAEHGHNTRGHRGGSSGYKGVNFFTPKKRFRAQIRCKDKEYFLGYFRDEALAGRAYDKKAKELFGDFAYLNFPEEHG